MTRDPDSLSTRLPAREPQDVTPEMVRASSAELVALVDARLPERFWREPLWRLASTALVARMAGLVDTMALLADKRRPSDVLVLLRVLYEHVVTFAWLAIDPQVRVEKWSDHAAYWQRKTHNDALTWGHSLLTDAELAEADNAQPLPSLEKRAAEVDDYWEPRIPGFRPRQDFLSIRGLYVGIYRMASRPTHAQAESVGGSVDASRYPRVVKREAADDMVWSALAVPLFSMALMVSHRRLGWPDFNAVRAINDAFITDPDAELT